MQDAVRGGAADSRAWRAAGFACAIPKGVYRFRTHEEADQWLMDHLVRKNAN